LGWNAESVEVIGLTPQSRPQVFFDQPAGVIGALAASVGGALGSIEYTGGGEEIKEPADGNAVHLVDKAYRRYAQTHPDEAIVVIADEGAKDESFSIPLRTVYYSGFADKNYSHLCETHAELKELVADLRRRGVKVKFAISDALDNTNAAKKGKNDSWCLVALMDDYDDGRLPEFTHDQLRLGSMSGNVGDVLGVEIGPFDTPSVAIRKIAQAQALADGVIVSYPDGNDTEEFKTYLRDVIAHVRVMMLTARPSGDLKSGESALHRHYPFLHDLDELRKENPQMGYSLFPEGDCAPRIVAGSGYMINGQMPLVFGRGGAPESMAAVVVARNTKGGLQNYQIVSDASTKSDYLKEFAWGFTEDEWVHLVGLGVVEDDGHLNEIKSLTVGLAAAGSSLPSAPASTRRSTVTPMAAACWPLSSGSLR
jgi:hypothetical protein